MTARGIRNKNPGNLRHGSKWKGRCKEQTDKSFIQFESFVYGIRALMKTLKTYFRKYHLTTIEQIIHRWAPTNENDTDAYIKFVCEQLNCQPDEDINLNDKDVMIALAKAIALYENDDDALLIPEECYTEAFNML